MWSFDSGEDSCMVFWVDSICNLSKEYNSSFFTVELPPTTCDHNIAVHNMKYLRQTVTKKIFTEQEGKGAYFYSGDPCFESRPRRR